MDKFEIIEKNDVKKYELEVKKSKFLSYVYYVNNKEQIQNLIEECKANHKGAKHVVYAYMLKNTGGFTDDKEPQGTAGKAIYTYLEKEKLINVLVIVVRYFGGILLGTGPLTRAYTTAAKEAVNQYTKKVFVEYEECSIECDYCNLKKVKQNIINSGCVITGIEHTDKVRITYLKEI